jgi:DNA-binding transcriptional LysR family regulator
VLDLAYLSVTERVESHGLGLHQLMSEELVVILPSSHRLSTRSGIKIGELAGEQFISYREGSRLRELLNRAAREADFDPHVMLESNESGRIRRLVHRGMGVAILPRSDTERAGAEVAVVALEEPALTRDITLAWRQGRRQPPAVSEFIELSRTLFSDTS